MWRSRGVDGCNRQSIVHFADTHEPTNRSCSLHADSLQAMSPEEVWRTRGVDGCNRQSIAQLVALVEAAAQQPPSGDLPWSPPRLNVHAH